MYLVTLGGGMNLFKQNLGQVNTEIKRVRWGEDFPVLPWGLSVKQRLVVVRMVLASILLILVLSLKTHRLKQWKMNPVNSTLIWRNRMETFGLRPKGVKGQNRLLYIGVVCTH